MIDSTEDDTFDREPIGPADEIPPSDPVRPEPSGIPPGSTEEPRAIIQEFLPEPSSAPMQYAKPALREVAPGPGLPEAAGWTFGVLAIHFGLAIGLLVLVMLGLMVAAGGNLNPAEVIESAESEYMILITGADQILFVLVVAIAVWMRVGREPDRKLALVPIAAPHVIMIVLLMLPLAFVAGAVYSVSFALWSEVTSAIPALKFLDELQTMEALREMAESASVPVLLVIIAVAPAIGEELVFRGLIGRGLVARWGIVVGVLLTTVFFAVVHLHPAHILGVLPIGICLHVVYLAARSLWAPMLLHFLNNSWAVVATKMATDENLEHLADDSLAPPYLLLSALGCACLLIVLIWKTRVRYYLPDGSEWTPGYATASPPPADVPAIGTPSSAGRPMLAITGLSLAAFIAALLVYLVENAPH